MKQTLSQIASVTMGQSPSSNFYNNEHQGLPFLQGCTTFGRLYPTYDIWTTSYNKEALPGDILFTVRAPVGDVNLCKDHIAIGRGLASIRATTVLPRYLFYILEANKGKFQSASSGTIYQSINKDKLADVLLEVHSPDEQQHIVGTIGSVDDLIEKNQKTTSKLTQHALALFDLEATKVGTEKLGKHIHFVKGKKPQPSNEAGSLPYLSIDALTGQEPVCSSDGVLCEEEDILMVMDGASSGKVFTGFKGYVGSTLAKVVTDLPAPMVYIFLYKHQEDSMDNTKGSAIPHADKRFIGELEIPMINDHHAVDKLSADFKLIVSLRKENEVLKRAKNTLLSKYF